MKNTRTLISSSIVSIIVVALGLFLLCMGGAPKVNIEDEPLVEGGGVEFDSVGVSDDEFLSLLNDASDEVSLTEDNNSQTTNSDDDIFAELFSDDTNQESVSNESPSESSDDGMNEILRLLEMDSDLSDNNNSELVDQNNQMTEYGSSDAQNEFGITEESSTGDTQAASDLTNEIDELESLLGQKSSEIEDLQSEINKYDQKINDLESQMYAANPQSTPVQPAGYYESTRSEESAANGNDNYTTQTQMTGDYESAYNYGLELFHNHQYQEAIDQFYHLLESNSRHSLADNCQYWIGESYFAQGKYYDAISAFNKVFAYDAPDKKDDAQLMLGMAFVKIGDSGFAKTEFDWLVSCYSSSEYLNRAYRYLNQL